ncbi:hypothetical protein PSYRMG_20065 [Pseudomonas syringae UMAF0158]|nr:hypothetical protein PSYRMG_20065 [Pseudomonas syringae UMAF0158]
MTPDTSVKSSASKTLAHDHGKQFQLTGAANQPIDQQILQVCRCADQQACQ